MSIFNNRLKLNKTAAKRGMSFFMAAVFVVGAGSLGLGMTGIIDKGAAVNGQAEIVIDEDLTSETNIGSGMLNVAAKSAVLMDVGTKTILYSQNGDEQLPPASITKIMTMLLVMEAVDSGQISLEDQVAISERAASMGGSQMYMEPGEIHTVEELMKGISMVSANDGAVAMAEYLCGSVEIFVEKMNQRAQELGMVNTHFVNTNGSYCQQTSEQVSNPLAHFCSCELG